MVKESNSRLRGQGLDSNMRWRVIPSSRGRKSYLSYTPTLLTPGKHWPSGLNDCYN